MSVLSDCCNPCPTVTAVNVPGTPGAAGTAGVNAFTTVTDLAGFTLPAQFANVTFGVASSEWMAVGQIIFVSDGTNTGTFEVVAVPAVAPFTSCTLEFLQYSTDSAPTTNIATGAIVTPAGVQATLSYPISVAHGGTGATTAATARANLGAAASGANSDITSLNTLSTPLSVNQGGTGQITVAAALTAFTIQFGTVALVNGVATVNTKNIASATTTVVSAFLITPAGTRSGFAGYKITSQTIGTPGSFVITAISDTGAATLGSCTDTVGYHILN